MPVSFAYAASFVRNQPIYVRTAGKETAFFWNVTYKLLSEAGQGDALTLDVEHDRVTDSDGCPEPQPREECHPEERLIVRTVCDGAR